MRKTQEKAKHRLHKTLLLLVILLASISSSCIVCFAEENSNGMVESRVDSILDQFYEVIPDDFHDLDSVTESVGVKRILEGIILTVKGKGNEVRSFLTTLLGIALMISLATVAEGELTSFASRAVGAVSAVLLFNRLILLVTGAMDSLEEISDFFSSVLPITVAVNTLGVTPSTAVAQATGMGITLSLYSYIAREMIGPIVSLIFVLSAASGIDPLLGKLSRCVKNLFLSVIGALSILVGASFSLQSVICSSADSAIVRGARYAVSSGIPIVGGVVSSTLSVALGGVSYARGVIGAGAIAVILSLVLSPLVILLIYRLCLKGGIFLSSLCSIDGCESVLSSFLGAIDSLIALYTLTSIVYIVELVAFLKGGALLA